MQFIDNIPIWGAPDPGAVSQIKTCALAADKVALMADHHKGYAVPIGGVVAYKDAISPSGVGYDIACGNKAVRVDMPGSELRASIQRIMDEVWSTISFGVGRKNNERVEHALFESGGWKARAASPLKEMARQQLGTVGSGNHYVDLFTDEQDRVWIGVHFGSRGLGHKLATWFLEKGGAKDGMDVAPCVIPASTDLGEQYIVCMNLAGEYAYAGRDWVCQRVARILGAEIQEEVHNHHNFAWRESHGGEDYWVVRKGATPAFPGQKGFVGGTMGETESNSAARASTNHRTVTNASPKSSPNTATAFASSTPSPPSASPWPAQTNSIPTRTDFPGARRSYEGSAINSRFKNVDYGHSLCGAFSF